MVELYHVDSMRIFGLEDDLISIFLSEQDN